MADKELRKRLARLIRHKMRGNRLAHAIDVVLADAVLAEPRIAEALAAKNPYFAWEEGYQAAVDDRRRYEWAATLKMEHTSNPYSLGEPSKPDREAELIAKATPQAVFDEAMAARKRLADRQQAEREELAERQAAEREPCPHSEVSASFTTAGDAAPLCWLCEACGVQVVRDELPTTPITFWPPGGPW